MTHRQRVIADRLVALPLEFAFNGLARALGATLRRDHTMSPPTSAGWPSPSWSAWARSSRPPR